MKWVLIFWFALHFLLLAAVIGGSVYAVRRVDAWYKKPKLLAGLAAGLLLALYAFWQAFSTTAHYVFYQGCWKLLIFWGIPLAIGAAVALLGVHRFRDGRKALGGFLIFGAAIVVIAAASTIGPVSDWRTANDFAFTEIEQLPPSNPEAARYLCYEVAHHLMKSENDSQRHIVKLERLIGCGIDGAFGYIAPCTPSPEALGAVTFGSVSGFVELCDSAQIPEDTRRARKVDTDCYVGEGMWGLDSLMRALYAADPLCEYPDIYYASLASAEALAGLTPEQAAVKKREDGDKVYFICPKVRHYPTWPWGYKPAWAGVSLVDSTNGKVTSLSVAQAQADPRLQKKLIYPISLALHYVKVQNDKPHPFHSWWTFEGNNEIPQFKSHNQMPFVEIGADGCPVLVVQTEPEGQSTAMNHIYRINGFTGERTVFSPAEAQGTDMGAREARLEIYSQLPGTWIREEAVDDEAEGADKALQSIRGHRAVEPLPVHRDGVRYYRFALVTSEFSRQRGVALVNAGVREAPVLEFNTRGAYRSWLRGKNAVEQPAAKAEDGGLLEEVGTIRSYLEQTQSALEEARKRLDSLQKKLDSRSAPPAPQPKESVVKQPQPKV